jgi:hypothetical protein
MAPVSTRSVPPGTDKHPPSTREIVVDDRYARLLSEDLGIKETTARTCFLGEPCKRALGVVAWCHEHAPQDPKKRARMALMWARKRKAGAFRPDAGDKAFEEVTGARKPNGEDDAEREIARRIAEYWKRHPEKLAEVLREAMNGRS